MIIRPFGEAALLVELAGPSEAQRLAASLRDRPLAGVVEAVPALSSVLIELDPLDPAGESVADEVERRLVRLPEVAFRGRARTIPVVYGGEAGPDLDEVATLAGLSAAEVVALHLSSELRVLFCGFAPGFAYLGDLPERIRVPRLATPRTRTPAGSVGLAEAMSGIYPAELPGGWRVIGRTPVVLFDPHRDPPVYLAPGDTVHFEPISSAAWGRYAAASDDW